jgi:hypothetical protein
VKSTFNVTDAYPLTAIPAPITLPVALPLRYSYE